MNNKKKGSAVVAVATAAMLLLGGTFAWQSISQTALNEASDVINPGGRLHDDFYIDDDGEYNSDIYVENFAEDDIFARVKLSEYMEIVVNKGVEGAEKVETVVGSKSLNGNPVTDKATDNTSGYEYEYVTHYFGYENATDALWSWTTGDVDSESVYYMPTFNKNKDSLVADRNGMYVDRIGGISNRSQAQYEDYTVWNAGDATDGVEIYDADSNQTDEVKWDFENLSTYEDAGAIVTKAESHTADLVGETKGLISIYDWLWMVEDAGEYNQDTHGGYWVYDDDGWVYWSSPIKAGKTTGLLLDAIDLKNVMDDTWYYAIEAEGQFITADDLGQKDDTGFFANDESVSDSALQLLEKIGVKVEKKLSRWDLEEDDGTIEIDHYPNGTYSDLQWGQKRLLLVNDENYTINILGIYAGNDDDLVPANMSEDSSFVRDTETGNYYFTVGASETIHGAWFEVVLQDGTILRDYLTIDYGSINTDVSNTFALPAQAVNVKLTQFSNIYNENSPEWLLLIDDVKEMLKDWPTYSDVDPDAKSIIDKYVKITFDEAYSDCISVDQPDGNNKYVITHTCGDNCQHNGETVVFRAESVTTPKIWSEFEIKLYSETPTLTAKMYLERTFDHGWGPETERIETEEVTAGEERVLQVSEYSSWDDAVEWSLKESIPGIAIEGDRLKVSSDYAATEEKTVIIIAKDKNNIYAPGELTITVKPATEE